MPGQFPLRFGIVAGFQSVRVIAPVADRDAEARAQGAVLADADAERFLGPGVRTDADAERDDDYPGARDDSSGDPAAAADGEHDRMHD